jgi:hypothetical protein
LVAYNDTSPASCSTTCSQRGPAASAGSGARETLTSHRASILSTSCDSCRLTQVTWLPKKSTRSRRTAGAGVIEKSLRWQAWVVVSRGRSRIRFWHSGTGSL